MTDYLVNTIMAFDKFMKARFAGKFYGIAELVDNQGELFPVSIDAFKRQRISPADTWQLQTFHRVLNIARVPGDEFGRNTEFIQSMRMIVIANVNMGESFIYRFVDAFPSQLFVTGAFAIVQDAYRVEQDHMATVTGEFGSIWQDKHRLIKNIWAINYDLKITLSDGCSPEDMICEWILTDGFWDDKGCWLDSDTWND